MITIKSKKKGTAYPASRLTGVPFPVTLGT